MRATHRPHRNRPRTDSRSHDVADEMAGEGILSMLSARLETAEQRRLWLPTAILMAVTWLGFVGISGAHLGGGWREPLWGAITAPVLYAGATAILALAAATAGRRGQRALALLAGMLTAYLLGNLLSGLAHRALDPRSAIESVWLGFIASRLLYTAAVTAPMFLIYLLVFRGAPEFALGVGDWRRETKLGRNDPPRSWSRVLVFFLVAIAVPGFLLLQAIVGFAPLTSGRLAPLLVPIVLMALANAFAEELIFRGLLHGAAIRAAGPAFGIWAVSLLFGIHHWGTSFAAIGSLPMALALGAGSVLFAKSVIETRGLAWAICAHALVDVCLYSAYYVAVP